MSALTAPFRAEELLPDASLFWVEEGRITACVLLAPCGDGVELRWLYGSRAEELSVEVTLPGSFPAHPGDRVELSLSRLGLSGTYRVAEAENVCSPGAGSTVTLTLKEGTGNVAF